MALLSSSLCLPIIVDAGQVSEKLLDRWANIYIAYILRGQGEDKEWVQRFLPFEYHAEVGTRVRKELRKRGYKVLD